MFLLIAAVFGFQFYVRYVQAPAGVTPSAIADASTIVSYVLLAVVVLSAIYPSRWCRPLIVTYVVFELCRYYYLGHIGYFSGDRLVIHAAVILLLGTVWFLFAHPFRKNLHKE